MGRKHKRNLLTDGFDIPRLVEVGSNFGAQVAAVRNLKEKRPEMHPPAFSLSQAITAGDRVIELCAGIRT
jgi:hypothetical protein